MDTSSRYRSGWSGAPHERFVDQFQWDSGDWLYRYKLTGPAYRVTDAEKDAFVAAFDRLQRRFMWFGLTVVVPGIVLLFIAEPRIFSADGWLQKHALLPWSLFLLVQLLRSANDHAAFRVPRRALADRMPVAPALPRAERRRLMLEQLPDTVLVGTVTITILLLLYFALERPPIGLAGWAFIVACGVALTWALVQGARKWRLTRADYAANNLT